VANKHSNQEKVKFRKKQEKFGKKLGSDQNFVIRGKESAIAELVGKQIQAAWGSAFAVQMFGDAVFFSRKQITKA